MKAVLADFTAQVAAHMKLLLAAVIVIVVAGSIYADYRWRKWIVERKSERRE